MRELIVDSFAGGGGASLGITLALGRGPDVAINHDAAAIAMHEANHPETKHFVRYFGTAIGQHVTEPLYTITGKDRFGLVTVTIDGQPFVIVDIGMRMLTPRELARAQGFPDSYILTGTNTSQVARIGNSVSPPMARALVEANYSPQRVRKGAFV